MDATAVVEVDAKRVAPAVGEDGEVPARPSGVDGERAIPVTAGRSGASVTRLVSMSVSTLATVRSVQRARIRDVPSLGPGQSRDASGGFRQGGLRNPTYG